MAKEATTESTKKKIDYKPILIGAAGALAVVFLIGGVVFGIHSLGKPANKQNQFGQFGGQDGGPGGGMGGRGNFQGQRPTGGEFKSIDGSTITLTSQNGDTVTVTVNSDTQYTKDREDASLSDIKTGDTILVMGKQSDNKVTATRVIINPEFNPPAGADEQNSSSL